MNIIISDTNEAITVPKKMPKKPIKYTRVILTKILTVLTTMPFLAVTLVIPFA